MKHERVDRLGDIEVIHCLRAKDMDAAGHKLKIQQPHVEIWVKKLGARVRCKTSQKGKK